MDRMMAKAVNKSAAASAEAVSSCANMGIILDAALLASIFVALLSLRLCTLISLISLNSLISLLALLLGLLLALRIAVRLKARFPIFA